MGDTVEKFIERWKPSGGSEQANSQSFLKELCALLKVDAPQPTRPDDPAPAYAFERQVVFDNRDGTTSPGRIDLYKRGCFVLESKQGISTHGNEGRPLAELANERPQRRKAAAVRHTPGWDEVMLRAKGQAEGYARALPAGEGRPPFIVVVDVGHCLELYAEFSMTGGTYIHFPDPQSHRISLDDLRRPELRERLRLVWTDPLALDPSRRAAKVTREIAAHLAELAKSLEAAGHRPEDAAVFLMRCLFTMFAEDVGLIPARGFAKMLAEMEATPANFKPMAEDLWKQMKTGGFWSYLQKHILHFNGYLFAEAWALDLDVDQVRLLGQAAKSDWQYVEPAIFGTLLERALDPVERHKLGAHYTPRAYVERLVLPTIVEPLRKEWMNVQAAVAQNIRADAPEKALAELRNFHRRLCEVRILDPACGTGNFLYVSLEHLKRLEGEVLGMAEQLGHRQAGFELASGRTVDPHQFLGIEINPRAAAIAELVLWIGYLQWHFRTHQTNPPEPIIRDFKSIECRDAVLAWDRTEPVLDPETLQPVTRWDGRTYKKSPVTGENIPDDSARVLVERYINPRKAKWPAADFVVGNPPFMGIAHLRQAMGDGYAETIRKTYSDVPGSCDYVLYWWNQAAELVRQGKIQRFGFITTNSLRQTLNRRLIEKHLSAKKPLSIIFAIPDHPWVDASDGAAVRISMTVGQGGELVGRLLHVTEERNNGDLGLDVALAEKTGKIQPDLTVGANLATANPLISNESISNRGMQLIGSGFIVTPDQANAIGLGSISGLKNHIRLYRNGRDITNTPRHVMAIDLFGLSEKAVQERYPEVYQWVLERVKPERDHNNRSAYRSNWWIFGEPRAMFRPALVGLSRYIATVETAKHRFFTFLDQSILPDNMLVNMALEDAYFLGVLSSSAHVAWAL
ncbi:MAG: DNA methyltransferase, partial [Pseudomonadota bacterium]